VKRRKYQKTLKKIIFSGAAGLAQTDILELS